MTQEASPAAAAGRSTRTSGSGASAPRASRDRQSLGRALGIVAAEEVAAARRRTVGLLERPRELFARDGVEGDDLARAVDDGDAVRKAIDDPAASSRS